MSRAEVVIERTENERPEGREWLEARDGAHHQAACPAWRLPLGWPHHPHGFYGSAPSFISRVETMDGSDIVKLGLFVPVPLSRS